MRIQKLELSTEVEFNEEDLPKVVVSQPPPRQHEAAPVHGRRLAAAKEQKSLCDRLPNRCPRPICHVHSVSHGMHIVVTPNHLIEMPSIPTIPQFGYTMTNLTFNRFERCDRSEEVPGQFASILMLG